MKSKWVLTFTVTGDMDKLFNERPIIEIARLAQALSKIGDSSSFAAEWSMPDEQMIALKDAALKARETK